MGYIHEFEVKLTELLTKAGMDEATRKEVLTYVKRTVVESYKNGIEAGKAASIVRSAISPREPVGPRNKRHRWLEPRPVLHPDRGRVESHRDGTG